MPGPVAPYGVMKDLRNTRHACKNCGEEFRGSHGKTYCSERCRASGTNRVPDSGSCTVCGKETRVTYSGGKRYLPTTCGGRECKATLTLQGLAKRTGKRDCVVCGETFDPRTTNQTVCMSKGCRKELDRRHRADRKEGIFVTHPHTVEPCGIFCDSCAGLAHRRPRGGCPTCGKPRVDLKRPEPDARFGSSWAI